MTSSPEFAARAAAQEVLEKQLDRVALLRTPDPFAPGWREGEVAWGGLNQLWAQPLDVIVAPAPDLRISPEDPIAANDDLGPPDLPPGRDHRRRDVDETRFLSISRVDSNSGPVFEILRVVYTRPGYVVRLATFLEVLTAAGSQYISNDLSDPDPFPVSGVTVVWHLRLEEMFRSDYEPAFLVAAPVMHIPPAHRVDMLPAVWADMRYHWGQRSANKVARVAVPCLIRLFAEIQGASSTTRFRVGGQIGGWEGEK